MLNELKLLRHICNGFHIGKRRAFSRGPDVCGNHLRCLHLELSLLQALELGGDQWAFIQS